MLPSVISCEKENTNSWNICHPLSLFIEFLSHGALWMSSTKSISILKVHIWKSSTKSAEWSFDVYNHLKSWKKGSFKSLTLLSLFISPYSSPAGNMGRSLMQSNQILKWNLNLPWHIVQNTFVFVLLTQENNKLAEVHSHHILLCIFLGHFHNKI